MTDPTGGSPTDDDDRAGWAPHMRAAHESHLIQKELLASPEWAHAARFDAFGPSVRLLEANACELRRAVHYLTKDRRSILFDRLELEPWLEEIARLLHNVVVAVATLVDHTRALVSDLYGDAGVPGYEDRLATLLSNPVVPFVQNLRNVFLHWKLPPIVHSTGQGWDRSLVLRRKVLLEWKRWSSPARRFVKDGPERIEIAPVIEQYLALIREFYEWFAEQETAIHRDKYDTVNAKLAAARRAHAPHVFHELRESLSTIESGHRPICGPLEELLGVDDRRQYEQLREHLPSWVDTALWRIAELYGEIPQDIVARFRIARPCTQLSSQHGNHSATPRFRLVSRRASRRFRGRRAFRSCRATHVAVDIVQRNRVHRNVVGSTSSGAAGGARSTGTPCRSRSPAVIPRAPATRCAVRVVSGSVPVST